jgi:anti-sigma-K factor RskA
MTHEPFDTQAAAYALGALDAEERARFETHLADGCLRCVSTLRESGEVAAMLAAEAPRAVPPAGVREALLRRAAADHATARPAARLREWWTPWAVAAAAAVLLAVLGTMVVTGGNEARLQTLAQESSALREELRQRRTETAMATLLRDPATRIVALHGAGPLPAAEGRVVWHPTAGGVLLVSKLPPAGAGNAYELWTISAGRPRPAGVFDVDASGQATHRVDPTEQPVDVFAVTVEPEGGVPAPTGPIVLASKARP